VNPDEQSYLCDLKYI